MTAARQLQLVDWRRPDHAPKPERRDWAAEASAFFAERPDVLEMFCRIACKGAQGRSYVSAKWAWEETRRAYGGAVKLNNNHIATAGQIARQRYPELESKLRVRGRKA